MNVEMQFRTIAMDFWASLEHKLKYKKDVDDADEIVSQLKACADSIETLDYQMQEIRNRIDLGKDAKKYPAGGVLEEGWAWGVSENCYQE